MSQLAFTYISRGIKESNKPHYWFPCFPARWNRSAIQSVTNQEPSFHLFKCSRDDTCRSYQIIMTTIFNLVFDLILWLTEYRLANWCRIRGVSMVLIGCGSRSFLNILIYFWSARLYLNSTSASLSNFAYFYYCQKSQKLYYLTNYYWFHETFHPRVRGAKSVDLWIQFALCSSKNAT